MFKFRIAQYIKLKNNIKLYRALINYDEEFVHSQISVEYVTLLIEEKTKEIERIKRVIAYLKKLEGPNERKTFEKRAWFIEEDEEHLDEVAFDCYEILCITKEMEYVEQLIQNATLLSELNFTLGYALTVLDELNLDYFNF